ncbi:hypothetical protein [Acetobacterium sp. K1/6]|jgi:hypothetical protein|uniref:hypothetical protein n=1 Tax=Acetobacterium sp. K1/6 TaxID=3055467 RepID=UPI002ACA8005|nr:hypothetical protein [Acetobacterium sp. K1/6]MDZ5726527.1 hypothetical protein [Acetobacterium sp. K1/6]
MKINKYLVLRIVVAIIFMALLVIPIFYNVVMSKEVFIYLVLIPIILCIFYLILLKIIKYMENKNK